MLVSPSLPLAFSHIGQRAINQDTLYPAVGLANETTKLFIICDGMGGADKGEIASRLLCEAVAGYASSMGFPVFDDIHLKTALDLAYQVCTDYLREHPLVNRMGSTLALLQLHQNGVTVAHIGDSRVYQLRAGRILFQTQDHKQVNDMVEAGIITATQALTHPWRNRLSRAVVVSSDKKDANAAKSIPDRIVLTDIQEGDYFFMCTDGVLEQLDEYALETVLVQDIPDMAKLQALLTLCDGRTKDNYSGYLIGVQTVSQVKPVLASSLS